MPCRVLESQLRPGTPVQSMRPGLLPAATAISQGGERLSWLEYFLDLSRKSISSFHLSVGGPVLGMPQGREAALFFEITVLEHLKTFQTGHMQVTFLFTVLCTSRKGQKYFVVL